MKKNIFYKKSYFLILIVSSIFIIPQIITKNMVVGSDAIFHFNRFFETSEQIRNGNFEYFISIYGFQQSGRIVNALYGPFVAYLNGLVVLMSKNWFTYQIISNFILYNVAGFSMFKFLISGHIDYRKSLLGAMFYMCTFSILYWTTRQGFSSWGSAIMPLCLSLIFGVIEKKSVPKFRLGISVALLFQTHILSTFMLLLIFTPIFIFSFFNCTNKFSFFKDSILEILLFILLTLNIWIAYFTITMENKLITPFINYTMSLNSIDKNSFYWIVNPASLIVIIVLVIVFFLQKWNYIPVDTKIIFVTMMCFLILSTSIIPWDFLVKKHFFIAEIIQFPFRFFTPVTIISIYLFLKMTNFKKLMKVFVIFGLIQVVVLMFVTLNRWNNNEMFILSGSKTIFKEKDAAIIKKSFFSKNKEEALKLVLKSTPDYLPLYGDDNSFDKYKLYEKKIIDNDSHFKKSINQSSIIIKETNFDDAFIEFPIIIYAGSKLTTMGVDIKREHYSLSPIGTPIINKKYINNNQIEIEFNNQNIYFFIYMTIFFWILVIIKLFLFSGVSIKR